MSEEFKFPELSIMLNGSSGIEIRAKLSRSYDHLEFTLDENRPQSVFISPWFQWEPAEMREERAKIAHGIVHRVVNYDSLVKEVATLQSQIESFHKREDRFRKQIDVTADMWKAERVKFGLPEDFSDINAWPAEMMSDYILGKHEIDD